MLLGKHSLFRLQKGKLLTIQGIHETFAWSLSHYLESKLKSEVRVVVTSVNQLYYKEYILSICNPSYMYIFNFSNRDKGAVMEFSSLSVRVIADVLSGGTGENIKTRDYLTMDEANVMKEVCDWALKSLQSSWEDVVENINLKYERAESRPNFVEVAIPKAECVVVTFEVMISKRPYLLNLCYPTLVLENIGVPEITKKELREVDKNKDDEVISALEILGFKPLTEKEYNTFKSFGLKDVNSRSAPMYLDIGGGEATIIRAGDGFHIIHEVYYNPDQV